MSASLVGSEMCIRDSPPSKAPRVMSPPECTRAERMCTDAVRGFFKAATGCLLYTSDAADDM
eukprot:8040443-Alexandrium_andersonii.AAC.1